MKKVYFIIFLSGIAISIGVGSCKKESDIINRSYDSNLQSGSSFIFYNFGADINEDDLLKNPDDLSYEKFNYVDYALTLAMLEVYTNHELYC